ncbi:hypothetical protein Poly24_32210 [Rosistilla carotiformis]|uniref:Uncharacterized protein n=1 Tax=Rosistilla carotiformis TaxID=2528017 RepID=A0A518JVE0_9BACT|nr:hypothetical protein Poly24_32210 [Rosistilla carotiformis]
MRRNKKPVRRWLSLPLRLAEDIRYQRNVDVMKQHPRSVRDRGNVGQSLQKMPKLPLASKMPCVTIYEPQKIHHLR